MWSNWAREGKHPLQVGGKGGGDASYHCHTWYASLDLFNQGLLHVCFFSFYDFLFVPTLVLALVSCSLFPRLLKVATGSLDGGRGFATNMAAIVAEDGWKGLYGELSYL